MGMGCGCEEDDRDEVGEEGICEKVSHFFGCIELKYLGRRIYFLVLNLQISKLNKRFCAK